MHRTLRKLSVLAIVLAIPQALALADEDHPHNTDARAFAKAAGVDPNTPSPNATPEQIALAKAIGKDVVCLCGTCPKRFVTDCDCGWAGLQQNALLNAVVAGKSREEIVHLYQQVYSARGLALPPDDDLLAKVAWALPYAGAAFGLFFMFIFGVKLMRKKDGSEREKPEEIPVIQDEAAEKELNQALEDLD